MVKFSALLAVSLLVTLSILPLVSAVSDVTSTSSAARLRSAQLAYDQLLSEKVEIEQQRDALAAQLLDSSRAIDDLTSQVQVLTNVNSEYLSLQEAVGSLEDIEANIHELEAMREPLIPDTSVGTFACTGSMEPAITCLDSATWLMDFDPAVITVGTVISFSTTPDCTVSSGNIAHRVIGIQYINGIRHFRTKGDNNWTDDGCWVPADNLHAYMIELHEDTQPENEDLRDLVNSARAAYDNAVATSTASLAQYNAYRTTFCPDDACPDEYVAGADAFYAETQTHLAGTQKAASAYVAALDKARGR